MGVVEAAERSGKASRMMMMPGRLAWARLLWRGLSPESEQAPIPWLRREKLSVRASLYLIVILSLGLWAMIGASIAELVRIGL